MIVTLLLLLLLGALIYWHLRIHFGVFERLGIPGPKPILFLGNLLEITKKGQLEAIIDWRGAYGRIFGYFEGYTPVLCISEPDVLKQILVKDFEHFQSRKPFPLAPKKSLGLFLENGKQWKRSRTILSPAFSSGKMRRMSDVMEEQVDQLLKNLKEKEEKKKSFDIYGLFQSLTLDVIGRCAFGLHTNAQTDPADEFFKNIKKLFANMSNTVILPIVMLFPVIQHFIFIIKNFVLAVGMNPVSWLRGQLSGVIKIRRDMGKNEEIADLVQHMLYPSKGEDGMANREVIAQSLTFLLAGYETTSAVLAFYCHLLAHNPDVQDKLRDEVKQFADTDINYKTTQEMPYMDMVFEEVCRLYPTASLIVTRQASSTRVYDDVIIPAGMNVQVDVWGLHHDPEYWTDPALFRPERFSSKNKGDIKPFTFLPFGAGPRSCIGSRFAMVETKIAISKILQQFEIEPIEGADEKMDLLCRGAIVPKDGVNVKLVRLDETDLSSDEVQQYLSRRR